MLYSLSHQGSPHITIALSYFADVKNPTRWEKLTVYCPQACRPQTSWNQIFDSDSQLSHHQPARKMYMSWSCSLWTITVRFITTLSRWGHTVLRALVHYSSTQSNKAILLYFSQNSVSEIQFHVRVQRSDLALLPMLKMLLSWVSLTWNTKEHNPYSWRPPLTGKNNCLFLLLPSI